MVVSSVAKIRFILPVTLKLSSNPERSVVVADDTATDLTAIITGSTIEFADAAKMVTGVVELVDIKVVPEPNLTFFIVVSETVPEAAPPLLNMMVPAHPEKVLYLM